MRTRTRHFPRAVDPWFRHRAVVLPLRTRQRCVFLPLGIVLSGLLALRPIASAQVPPADSRVVVAPDRAFARPTFTDLVAAHS